MALDLDAERGLYIRSRKVLEADVFWQVDALTAHAIGQKLLHEGMCDETITLIESLQSKSSVDTETKCLLASAYFQRVKNRAISTYVGGYHGLTRWGYDWRSDVERAIALDESVREEWVKLLNQCTSENIKNKSSTPELTNAIAKTALEFAQNNAKLKRSVYEQNRPLANVYISWATNRRPDDDYFIKQYLAMALSVVPEDAPTQREASRTIRQQIENLLSPQSNYPERQVLRELAELLGVLESLQLEPEAEDRHYFSQMATRVASSYKHNKDAAAHWSQRANEWSN